MSEVFRPSSTPIAIYHALQNPHNVNCQRKILENVKFPTENDKHCDLRPNKVQGDSIVINEIAYKAVKKIGSGCFGKVFK